MIEPSAKLILQTDVSDYYDARIEGKLGDFTDPNPRIEAAIQLVADWAPERPLRILEVGCGIGATSWRMARAWPEAQVIGLDISPQSIEVAQVCFQRPNLTFVNGLLTPDLLEPGFDLILLMDVYEHIMPADRPAVHAALDQILSADCRLILAFPTPTLQGYIREQSPQDLQPVDEDIGLDEIQRLANDTRTQMVYYRETGVWHYGDYAHLVLARYQSMADVRLRDWKHPSRMVRCKQAAKRLLLRTDMAEGLADHLGPDVLRPRPFGRGRAFHVSAAERRALARRWSDRRG